MTHSLTLLYYTIGSIAQWAWAIAGWPDSQYHLLMQKPNGRDMKRIATVSLYIYTYIYICVYIYIYIYIYQVPTITIGWNSTT